jgi:succinate dehydrogenase / fumarate reductase cytochrome b subunit
MLVDFVPKAASYQRIMFWTVMILTIVCFLPMAYFVLAPLFGVNTGNTASGM